MAEDIELKFGTSYDGKGASEAASSIQRHWADIKAGFDLVVSGIKTGWTAVTDLLQSPFKFETQTIQFKTLIGDIDEAKKHMRDLKELGDTPPFSLDQFAAASRTLMALTDGTLGYRHSLELIGDAAAATGAPLESLSSSIGFLYASIRDGEPVERATRQLSRMGVITPAVAAELADLQNKGESSTAVWQKVEEALGKFSGAMKESESTGAGLVAAIQTRWDNIVRNFGNAFAESVKDGLAVFLDYAKRLEEDGTLELWAQNVAKSIDVVVKAAEMAVNIGKKLYDAYAWTRDSLEKVGSAAGAVVGTIMSDGDANDAWEAAKSAWRDTSREQADRAADAAAAAASASSAAAARVKANAAAAADAVESENNRIKESLESNAAASKRAAASAANATEKEYKNAAAAALKASNDALKEENRLRRQAAKESADFQTKAVKDAAKAQLKEIDGQIAEARKKLQQWEAEAKLARGVNADDWRRSERDRQREADREQRRIDRETKRMQDETDRLKAKNPKLLTEADKQRLAENEKWLAAQNPANNPFQKQIDVLQEKRDLIQEKLQQEVGNIRKKLDSLGLK